MYCTTHVKNHLTKQKAKNRSFSRFTNNNITVSKLYLSRVSETDDKGILITAVTTGSNTENRIPLKLKHPGEFGLLQLSYIGSKFHEYFPADAIIKVTEILLKKSSTIHENAHDGDWDIVAIITEKKNDCNYLHEKAIKDNYRVIVAIQLKIIHANKSSRKLVLHPYGPLLHRAVANKDTKVIETFLKFKLSVNKKNNTGWTSLHVAIDLELADIVDLLISSGADVNVQNKNLQSLLHCVVVKNNLKILDSLIKSQAKLNIKDKDGQTPLHYSVIAGNANIVDILLKEGANYKLEDKLYRTPLHLASQQKNLDIIKVFLKHKVDANILNSRRQTPLFYLIEKPLRTQLKTVNKETYSTIIDAFLQNGATINFQDSKGRTPLYNAAIDNDRCFQAFLDCNTSVNAVYNDGKTVLHIAVEKKNYGAVEKILKKNPKINVGDKLKRTALHLAIESECLPIIELLLKNGADVNLKNSSGKAAISAIMYVKNKSIILRCLKVLLDHRADINTVDKDLTSPLHMACGIKNANVVKYLIENGADSSMRDKYGKTVFHYACIQSCKGITLGIKYIKEHIKDTLSILVKENISINCVDKFGRTPLHYVVKHKNLSFMNKLLLNFCADINIVDKDHLSPFDDLYKQSFHAHNGSSELATLYKQHVIKMKVMKLWVREKTLIRIYKAYNERHLEWIQGYERVCIREIDSMKIIYLAQTNISYYDFLIKSPHDLVIYTLNQNVVEAIQPNELARMFPNYSFFLKCQLRKVLLRRNLYDQIQKSLKSFKNLFIFFKKLPTSCMNEILRYLDTSDLTIFLEALKPLVSVK